MNPRPLDGVRVLDLTVVLSGTATTATLGDLGAEVVRVESRRHYPSATKGPRRIRAEGLETLGNTRRGYADRHPGDDPWNRFAVANVNAREKRSVTLELETAAGRAAFDDLVRVVDVLAENNAPGFLERRGLTPDALFALNPRLVLLRMPGAASTGSLAALRGMGPAFEAMAGLRDLRGYPDLPPDAQPESLYMDATTGPAAVAAVLAALRRRDAEGRGATVTVSQMGVMMDHATDQYLAAQVAPTDRPPRENWSWTMAPHGVYPTRGDDEWVAISCRDDGEWRALHELVSPSATAPLAAGATLAERLQRWDAVDAWLAGWCRDQTKGDAFLTLQGAGVAAAPLLRESELLTDPHMTERGAFPLLDHPVVGPRPTPTLPWRSSRWQVRARRAAPLLGEDNAYVLRDVLGYDEAAYRALVDADEIGTDYL